MAHIQIYEFKCPGKMSFVRKTVYVGENILFHIVDFVIRLSSDLKQ